MTATAPLSRAYEAGARVPDRKPWTAVGPPDAPGIVFIHGTRLTRAQWWMQVRLLAARYRCVAVDLPGHGALGAEAFTFDAAVEVVRRAVEEEVASGHAVLVGLSLGGYVAIETAEAHPDRVAGLVLAGCSAEALGPMALPYRFFRALLARGPGAAQQLVNNGFFRLRYGRRIAGPIVDGGFWATGGVAALTALMGRRYLDRLARLWTPVLVVNGALDPVFGPQGEYWAASCRRGRHVRIARAMHLSNLDRPVTFARLVAAFTDEATLRA